MIRKCKEADIDKSRARSEQKYCLYTKDGSKLLGRHPSKEAAQEQERAIYANAAIENLVRVSQSLAKDEITVELAEELGEAIGVDWSSVAYTPEALVKGMLVELEHGTISPETDVSGDDLEVTAKIALAHLNESADYYDLLAEMEKNFGGSNES